MQTTLHRHTISSFQTLLCFPLHSIVFRVRIFIHLLLFIRASITIYYSLSCNYIQCLAQQCAALTTPLRMRAFLKIILQFGAMQRNSGTKCHTHAIHIQSRMVKRLPSIPRPIYAYFPLAIYTHS